MLMLGIRSLWNRRFVALLTVVSIAVSVALILGVERLRTEARESFSNAASGIDLIVAPRGNSVQILLATVFGVGSTGTGLSWETYEWVEAQPDTAWAAPIVMGDNHRGFPVIGTKAAYFEKFRHSGGQALVFDKGGAFEDSAAVVGSEVAERFDYQLGTEIVLAHGAGAVAFDVHDDAPFTIAGILERTGTAVDRMVFVSLEGFDKLHEDKGPPEADPLSALEPATGMMTSEEVQDGSQDHADHDGHEHEESSHAGEAGHDIHEHDDHEHDGGHETSRDARHEAGHAHEPEKINAIYIGLTDRTATLSLQRALSELKTEPVSAVMPNVALLELWSITGTAEIALRLMASAVVLAGIVGLLVMLSSTLENRRREFSILRSVGAQPGHIFGLIVLEAGLLTLAGIVLGYLILTAAVAIAGPVLAADFGFRLDRLWPSPFEASLMVLIFAAGLAASLIPAWRVYRMTLSDGITVRI